jgi:hypothetical protein
MEENDKEVVRTDPVIAAGMEYESARLDTLAMLAGTDAEAQIAACVRFVEAMQAMEAMPDRDRWLSLPAATQAHPRFRLEADTRRHGDFRRGPHLVDPLRAQAPGVSSSPSRCGPTSLCVIGRTRDLPVPMQRASAHARVSDHAGPSGHSRSRARPCCLPRSEPRRHPGQYFFRGSMAGLCAPLPTFRRHPRGCQRTARGRGGFAAPSPWRTCTPYSLPVSRRTQIKSKLLQIMRRAGVSKPCVWR